MDKKKDGSKLLGKGMARKASKLMKGRKNRIDSAVEQSLSRGKAKQYR